MNVLSRVLHASGARRVAALGLLLTLVVAGCATGPAAANVALPRDHAEISVSNLTPHAWQLSLQGPRAAPLAVTVQPHETFAVTLPAGDYRIEQTLLAGEGPAPASRQFQARFESGQRYRWSLATLLSGEEIVLP